MASLPAPRNLDFGGLSSSPSQHFHPAIPKGSELDKFISNAYLKPDFVSGIFTCEFENCGIVIHDEEAWRLHCRWHHGKELHLMKIGFDLAGGGSKTNSEERYSVPSPKQDYESIVIKKEEVERKNDDHKNGEGEGAHEEEDDHKNGEGEGARKEGDDHKNGKGEDAPEEKARPECAKGDVTSSNDEAEHDSDPAFISSSPTVANDCDDPRSTHSDNNTECLLIRENPPIRRLTYELQTGLAVVDLAEFNKKFAAAQTSNKSYTKSVSKAAVEGFAVADHLANEEHEDIENGMREDKTEIPDHYYTGLEDESDIDIDGDPKGGFGKLLSPECSDTDVDDDNTAKRVKKKKKSKSPKKSNVYPHPSSRIPIQGQDRLVELAQTQPRDTAAAEKDEWW